ncbi:hypothetical protein D3C87_1910760 [compost metagenome]
MAMRTASTRTTEQPRLTMECLTSLIVMALAFFGAVAFVVYANYRFMKRIAEREDNQ